MTFSPDGRWLASAGDGSHLKLWEIATGRELRTLTPHTGRVFDVAFSPDGRSLASTGHQKVEVWDVSTGDELRMLDQAGGSNWVYSVAFSPDGRWLASAGWDNAVRLWEVASGRKLNTLAPGKAS